MPGYRKGEIKTLASSCGYAWRFPRLCAKSIYNLRFLFQGPLPAVLFCNDFRRLSGCHLLYFVGQDACGGRLLGSLGSPWRQRRIRGTPLWWRGSQECHRAVSQYHLSSRQHPPCLRYLQEVQGEGPVSRSPPAFSWPKSHASAWTKGPRIIT